jgi:hypothetical protein
MKEVKTDRCIPIRGDVFKYIASCREKFDFIFADPPYELPNLETLPDLIFEKELLKEGGIFVLEHGKKNNFEAHPKFVERRAYGSVNFPVTSVTVGSVSESYYVPKAYLEDPVLGFYARNGFGLKYLSLVYPNLIGNVGVVAGWSLP